LNPSDEIVKRKFLEYYASPNRKLHTPPKMEQREYGFLMFKEKFMVRHRGFKTAESLLTAARDLAPKHIYYSTAYYQQPTASMEEKGWLGADLVFDIDADHLETPCKTDHDTWKCKACNTTGKGTTPKLCPKCKNDRLDSETWLCEKCLSQAKEETFKLLGILYADFGINPDDIGIFFSGHRGYHVHVYSEGFRFLRDEERREIADYVLGQQVDFQLQGLAETKTRGVTVIEGPQLGEPGWRGRIVSGVYDLLHENGKTGLSDSLKAWDNKRVLEGGSFWSSAKGVGLSTWKDLAVKAVENGSARIDSVVTTDIHRLIRLPGTLNGNTGLLAMQVSERGLEDFDPFTDSIAFEGKLRIHVTEAPSLRIKDSVMGPFNNETVEIPEAAALILLCKHRAEPVGQRKS